PVSQRKASRALRGPTIVTQISRGSGPPKLPAPGKVLANQNGVTLMIAHISLGHERLRGAGGLTLTSAQLCHMPNRQNRIGLGNEREFKGSVHECWPCAKTSQSSPGEKSPWSARL